MPGAAFDDAAAGIAAAGAVAAQVPGSAFADAAMLASTGRHLIVETTGRASMLACESLRRGRRDI